VVLLLFWLPWLWLARDILLDYQGNGDSPGVLEALSRAFGAFVVGESVPASGRCAWAVLALAAMVLGAFVQWRRALSHQRSPIWFLVIYAIVPLAATWWSSQSRPIFNERYLVAAVPPVYLLMAAAVGSPVRGAWERWTRWELLQSLAVTLLLAAMLFGFVQQRTGADFGKSRGWRQLATTLEALTRGVAPERARLVQNYPDPTLWYYYRGDVAHLVLPPAAHDEARAREEVERMVAASVERVVLVEQPSPAWDDSEIGTRALAESYTEAAARSVEGWRVSLWLRPVEVPANRQVIFERGLELIGAQVAPVVVPPGGAVAVNLQWRTPAGSVQEQETVSVQLLNGAGALVAQSDRVLEPAAEGAVTLATYAILLPEMLPAGEYHLSVVVYDPSRPGAPRRMSREGDDSVAIGTITVGMMD
jgi:hypothetical protein